MSLRSSSPERILLLVAVCAVTALFVWCEWALLLLCFAGFLLAILLMSATHWTEQRTHLSHIPAYLITLGALLAIAAGAAALLAPRVVSEVDQLATVVPASLHHARAYLEQISWGKQLLHVVQTAMHGSAVGSRVQRMANDIVEGTVYLIVVLVIGFFAALRPQGYKRGLLWLIPGPRRKAAYEMGRAIVETLRWWLLGQLVPMAVLAVASIIALWILKVRLAFVLGLLTGILVFIPYVGSILSGGAAVLVALQRGTHTALLVVLLYLAFHLGEGYLLTPMVQRRAVRLPPIVTVLAQFFMWSFGGLLGVAVAAPLAAAAMTVVRQLYMGQKRHASRPGNMDIASETASEGALH